MNNQQFLDLGTSSENPGNSFVLIDSSLLCEFLNANLQCKNCDGKVSTHVCFEDAKGFCLGFESYCCDCNKKEFLFSSSKRCTKKGVFEKHAKQTPFEINARMVSFAREIGLG